MGVRSVTRDRRERRSSKRWTDETLRAALAEFITGPTWPTSNEFNAAGREDLRNAVKRHGGAAWWASELGLTMKPGQDRAPYTEDDAVSEAAEVVAELGSLPGKQKLRQLGCGRLATHVVATGGASDFAARHGFPVSAQLATQG